MNTVNGSGVHRSVTTGRVRHNIYGYVRSELRDLVEQHAASGVSRLEPEDELATRFGVSRATVRSALSSLQKEGVVQRVHGQGTFINRHALGIRANIARDWPFVDLIEQLGHVPRARVESLTVAPLPAELTEPLALESGEDACVVVRVFEASGDPAVLCVDYVPGRHLTTDVADLCGEESVFDFLRRHTGRVVRYSVAEIVPTVATPDIAEGLRVESGEPLLLLCHTHVDTSDRPLAFTRAYVNDRHIRFAVVRAYSDI